MSEMKSQSDTNAEMGPVAKLAEDEDYDEEEVCGYEDLELSTVAAAPRPSVYVGLAKAQTADTSDSTEHVDDDDNNDQDQVSKPTLKIIGKEFPDLL